MKSLIFVLILLVSTTGVAASFKLEIKKANGSIYWVDFFPSQISAQNWLDEEKTRNYWKVDYTSTIIEILPRVSSAEEIAIDLAKKQRLIDLKQDLITLPIMTLPKLREVVERLTKIVLNEN